jgi:MFS family permease
VITVFGLAHATEQLGVSRQVFLTAVLLGAVLECVAVPAFGALSDRVGRRTVYAIGLLTTGVWAFPAGILIGTGSAPLIHLAVGVAIGVGHAAAYASAAAFFTELFDTAHRCRGASLGYQIGALIGGGLVPLLTAALVAGAGGAWWPAAVVLAGSASLSLACLAALRETKDVGLTDLAGLRPVRA